MLDSDTLPFVAREDSAFFGYTYASPENVQEVAPFLVQSLKDLGLQTAELDLFSSEPAHVAAVVNVLHELVKQRHRDKAKQQENHEKLQKLRSDLRTLDQRLVKKDEQLEEQRRTWGSLELQLRQVNSERKKQDNASSLREQQDLRKIRELQSDLKQAEARMRAKDREIDELTRKLSHALYQRPSTAPAWHTDAAHQQDGFGHTGHAANARPQRPMKSPTLAALQGQLQQAQAQVRERDARLASQERELRRAHEECTTAQRQLAALTERCESLRLPVAAGEVSSLAEARSPALQPRDPMRRGQETSLPANCTLKDMELVRDRCKALLSTRTQRAASAGGAGRAVVGYEQSSHQQIMEDTMRDMEKALSHAINLLKREQAKLEAAQARADAARKRVIELEERENERERAAAAAAATAAAAAAEASSAAHTPQHSHLYGPAVSGAGDGGMGTRTAARNNQLHSQPHQLHYKSPLPAQPGTASSLQAPTPSSVYQGSHQGSMQPRAVEPELSDAVHGLAPVDDEDTAGTKRCETFKVCDNALWGTAEGRSSLGGAAVSHEGPAQVWRGWPDAEASPASASGANWPPKRQDSTGRSDYTHPQQYSSQQNQTQIQTQPRRSPHKQQYQHQRSAGYQQHTQLQYGEHARVDKRHSDAQSPAAAATAATAAAAAAAPGSLRPMRGSAGGSSAARRESTGARPRWGVPAVSPVVPGALPDPVRAHLAAAQLQLPRWAQQAQTQQQPGRQTTPP